MREKERWQLIKERYNSLINNPKALIEKNGVDFGIEASQKNIRKQKYF